MSPNGNRPSVDRPLLVGILLDVSGSMIGAIDNGTGSASSRLESVRDALGRLVRRGAELSEQESGESAAALISIFAYGFGFGNPLSFLFSSQGAQVRDLLQLPGRSRSTISIDHLSAEWDTYESHFERLARDMLGSTPMGEALHIAEHRLRGELDTASYFGQPTIFLLSDGVPTDATPSAIVEAANRLKDLGALVISCFVTDTDITEPRRLYGQPPPDWPEGAVLMFDCASPLPRSSSFSTYLEEYRWRIDPQARLFAQVNQSQVLSEFMNLVLSPLDPEAVPAPSHSPRRLRVFVSYSHQDERYRKELTDFLAGLERQGFDLWSDRRVETGELWDSRIREEIDRSDIALVLVSQNFLNSSYCRDVEVENFLRRRAREGLYIYPVILSPCDWKGVDWLSSTQFQPRDGETIEESYKDKGKRKRLYLTIQNELARIGDRLRAPTSSS